MHHGLITSRAFFDEFKQNFKKSVSIFQKILTNTPHKVDPPWIALSEIQSLNVNLTDKLPNVYINVDSRCWGTVYACYNFMLALQHLEMDTIIKSSTKRCHQHGW